MSLFSNLFVGVLICFLGSRYGFIKLYFSLFFSYFLSLIFIFFSFLSLARTKYTIQFKLFDIISFSDFIIPFSFRIDILTITMAFIVIIISFFVSVFSVWYMKNDPNQIKFMNYLNLFTFFMMLLVTTDSLIIVFIGWEGIGMFSYLLINFWNTRLNANRSALKALVVNKIGDVFLYFFISLYFFVFNTFSDCDNSVIWSFVQNDKFIFITVNLTFLICICIFIAGMAKSAQFFMHVWLPDAMEGPTPVSALLHAATMVTAGAYLLIKYNWIFGFADYILYFIIFIGVVTNFISSFIAIFQYDIKKVIAYSTASQMGLIFIGIGLFKPIISFFHLYNHAFFKALLFILAGVVIHFFNNKQDLRFFNNIKNENFFLYSSFLISLLTLAGTPFLSAYYSKELVINSVFFSLSINSYYLIIFSYLSVITTVVYSLKIFYYLFISKNYIIKLTNKFTNISVDTVFDIVRFVCFSLIIFSIVIGYLSSNVFFFEEFFYSTYMYFDLTFLQASKFLINSYNPLILILFLIFIIVCMYAYAINFFFSWLFFNVFCSNIMNIINRKFYFDNVIFYFFKFFLFLNFFTKEEKNFNENSFLYILKKRYNDKILSMKYLINDKILLPIMLLILILNLMLLILIPKYFILSLVALLIYKNLINLIKWLIKI